MKVTNGYNQYAYQQQRTNGKDKGFADMLENMSANKSAKHGASEGGGRRSKPMNDDFMRIENPHRHHETQNKPTAEELASVEASRGALQYHEACPIEVAESNVPEPTYPKSIYDFSYEELKEAKKNVELACSSLDTSGMTKGEIYREIEQIYKDYLGEDFLEMSSLYHGNTSFTDHEMSIWFTVSEFHGTLIHAGVKIGDSEAVREARGYAGMSDDEIREVVRAQYPENMTLKDCILMGRELYSLGFDEGGLGNIIDRITSILGLDWGPEAKQIYDTLYSMPASYDAIKDSYDAFVKDEYKTYPIYDIDNLVSRLLSFFGGNESASSELISRLTAMLNKMQKEGDFAFDEYGYCGSTIKKE